MERGTRLEPEALERFTTETGKKVVNELVIWTTDDNEGIASSPDGIISDTEAIETKCLSSARHIEAYLKQEVPDEYEFQVLQYFIVNDKLQTLYIAFYDPRIPGKDFFYLEVNRADKEAEIAQYLEYQKNILKEVDEVVLRLSNF
jgi:predicted phage-related endonuclease